MVRYLGAELRWAYLSTAVGTPICTPVNFSAVDWLTPDSAPQTLARAGGSRALQPMNAHCSRSPDALHAFPGGREVV